jgi:hypothetical protein
MLALYGLKYVKRYDKKKLCLRDVRRMRGRGRAMQAQEYDSSLIKAVCEREAFVIDRRV